MCAVRRGQCKYRRAFIAGRRADRARRGRVSFSLRCGAYEEELLKSLHGICIGSKELQAAPSDQQFDDAITLMALCVGGLSLSRAVIEKGLSEQVIEEFDSPRKCTDRSCYGAASQTSNCRGRAPTAASHMRAVVHAFRPLAPDKCPQLIQCAPYTLAGRRRRGSPSRQVNVRR